MKCNDNVYGKVLQLLTLAVYVTQDLQARAAAGEGRYLDKLLSPSVFFGLILIFAICVKLVRSVLFHNWYVFMTFLFLYFYRQCYWSRHCSIYLHAGDTSPAYL